MNTTTTTPGSFSAANEAETAAVANRALTDAELTGAAPIRPAGTLPQIAVKGKSVTELATTIVDNLPPGLLFNYRGLSYVTLSPNLKTGLIEPREMDSTRFITWLEKHIRFTSNTRDGQMEGTSLSEPQARAILASDILRDRVPLLREIAPVRLPLWQREKDATYTFHPAPVGYDPRTQIYTQDTLPIDWTRPPHTIEEIHTYFASVFCDFPLDGGKVSLDSSPSFSTVLVAMLGQYLRHNIARYPIIIVNANQPGSGKSFLIRTILAPFYGEANVTNYVADELEFRKILNSLVQDGSTYCFLDDLRLLVSSTVNRFVTSGIIKDRRMGTDKLFVAENRMQFFATGNNLHVETDILRRALSIDLFVARQATGRDMRHTISETGVLAPEWRAEMLAMLHSLCLQWVAQGCPLATSAMPTVTSFSDYLLPVSIIMACGFASPYAPHPLKLDAGDTMGAAIEELIQIVAGLVTPGQINCNRLAGDQYRHLPPEAHRGLQRKFTGDEILTIARDNHLLDIIVPAGKDEKRSLGNQMRTLKGKELYDKRGRLFRVASARSNVCSLYPITILSEPDPAHAAPQPADDPDDPSPDLSPSTAPSYGSPTAPAGDPCEPASPADLFDGDTTPFDPLPHIPRD